MLTLFEIVQYYGIRYEFKEIGEKELSCFDRRGMTVYIFEKYYNDNYATRFLLVYELGHFFLYKKLVSEMNIFPKSYGGIRGGYLFGFNNAPNCRERAVVALLH